MNEADLKDLAKSMGLKKVDSLEKDDLIYQIIDQQAIDASLSAPEAPKRRRGKSKKDNGDEAAEPKAKDAKKKSAKKKRKSRR